MTARTIAIVGTGPTGIYTLLHLLDTGLPLAVTLYEKGPRAGIGMPYSPEMSNRAMLANIASIEIPPIATTYLDWLQDQPDARLRSYGLDSQDLDERQFTPRLLLGEYFRHQLMALVDRARSRGHRLQRGQHDGGQLRTDRGRHSRRAGRHHGHLSQFDRRGDGGGEPAWPFPPQG